MISAILRAQLLSMRGMGLRRAGFWVGLIPNALFYAAFAGIGFGLQIYLSFERDIVQLTSILATGLLMVCAYWQLAPIMTNSMGASLDLKKLIVYPIAVSRLFLVEVLLRFFTVGEMLVVLLFAGVGIARNPVIGGWGALPRVLLGMAAYIAFNLLLAAGVRSLIEGFFRSRRTREIGMLIFVMLSATPMFIARMHIPFAKVRPWLPSSVLSPWGAAAHLLVGLDALAPVGVLAASLGVAYAFGRWQFFRNIRFDGEESMERAVEASGRFAQFGEVLLTLPSRVFRDPLACMVEKDFRSLVRTSAFRLAFFMAFTFGALPILPGILSRKSGMPNMMIDHILAWLGIYSVLLVGYYTFWNAFGFDREAAQFYFVAPVRFRSVLVAKNVTAAGVQLAEMIVIVFLFSFFPVPHGPLQIVEAFTVTGVTCLYLFGAGNILSVRAPAPLDPDKLNQGASRRSASAFSMILLPIGFLPIGLAYWGLAVFKSNPIFFGLLAIAGLIGGVFYWVALDSAVSAAGRRREQMIETLSRTDGPLSIR